MFEKPTARGPLLRAGHLFHIKTHALNDLEVGEGVPGDFLPFGQDKDGDPKTLLMEVSGHHIAVSAVVAPAAQEKNAGSAGRLEMLDKNAGRSARCILHENDARNSHFLNGEAIHFLHFRGFDQSHPFPPGLPRPPRTGRHR